MKSDAILFHMFQSNGLNARALTEECRRNRESLHDVCPDIRLTNFCYPFGRASLTRKRELEQHFDTCRGIYEG